ncbi:hypothetical protein FQN52_008594 [Onygenales sp. PD_12]|nr:hypothetical protein FQN52_008594 [Onygenales sp. PD_12]
MSSQTHSIIHSVLLSINIIGVYLNLVLAIRQTRFCVTTAPTNDRKLAPNLECEIKADRCQCVSEELQREMKNMQTKNQTKQTEIWPGCRERTCIRNKDLMLCRFQDDKDVWEKEKDEMRLAVVKLEKDKNGMGLEIANLKEEMKDQQRKIVLEAEKQREKINKEVAARIQRASTHTRFFAMETVDY